MAVDTRDNVVADGDHVVLFYEHDAELIAAVAPYVAAAVRGRETAIVVATEAHRHALEAELEASGLDPSQAAAEERFISLDAATTLASLMSADGRIDRDSFDRTVVALIRRAVGFGRPVRAYGEMVALLWDRGDVLAAIELETLWNELGDELSFSLFCSYRATPAAGSQQAFALQRICALHSSAHTSVLATATNDIDAEGPAAAPPQSGLSADFPADPDSPARARHAVAATLRRWGHGEQQIDDAILVVSELASNAVRHAHSPFSVSVRMEDCSSLRVAVADGMPPSTHLPNGGLIPRPLHGLGLIEAFCAGWGVERTREGKIVWARLSCNAPAP